MRLFDINGMPIDPVYDDIEHHGIKGQKWGVRRFQDSTGKLTPEGKKRYSEAKSLYKGKRTTLAKEGDFFRVSAREESDAEPGKKLYTNPNEYEHTTYKVMIATNHMLRNGEAWVQKYVSNNDIRLPSVKEQTKMEWKALKDPAVKNDVIESLVRKGMKREDAVNAMYASAGKETVRKLAVGALAAPVFVLNPAGGVRLGIDAARPNAVKEKQLRWMRVSVGDTDTKVLNQKLNESMGKKKYNAMYDTNDRGQGIAKSSVIILDPDTNVRMASSHRITKDEYIEAWVDYQLATGKFNKKYPDRTALKAEAEKQYDAVMAFYDEYKQLAPKKREEKAKEELAKYFPKNSSRR